MLEPRSKASFIIATPPHVSLDGRRGREGVSEEWRGVVHQVEEKRGKIVVQVV